MIKSILAVSEGGPDAGMSFALAGRVAGLFGGTVDALHLPVDATGGVTGSLAMTGEGLPLTMAVDDQRLEERSEESARAYKQLLGSLKGTTFTAAESATLDALVGMGRCSDLVVLGRPGSDPENVAPAAVEAALFESARPVMIAPPQAGAGEFGSVVVAWNGTLQAARALQYAMPFVAQARKTTLLVVGSKPDDVGAPYLVRNLNRFGIEASVDTINPGSVTGRARGRALLAYTHDNNADMLVMGAYGGGQMLGFLGLGGATGKVISSCRVPLLMAH